MKFLDYYKILGVGNKASQEDITKAYRKLARKYHPDLNKGKESEEKFKQLSEAYQVLGDVEKRKTYDQLGSNWANEQQFTPPSGWDFSSGFDRGNFMGSGVFSYDQSSKDYKGGSSATDFSDFFRAFFGGTQGDATSGEYVKPTSSRASSTKQDKGHTHSKFHPRHGDSPIANKHLLNSLHLKAEMRVSIMELYREEEKSISVVDDSSGETKTYKVKIPPGVTNGSTVRLAGLGKSLMGKKGDLLLTVNIIPDSKYKLDGSDISTTLNIAPWEAALGCKKIVELPFGKISLNIPPCTSSGKFFRVPKKGLHKAGGGSGDILVVAQIVMPESLTNQQKDLFEQLRALAT